MNLKRFTARNARDALTLVRQTFGEDAIVMSTRPCAEGVEVLAMAPESLQQFERMAEEAEPATLTGAAAGRAAALPPAAAAAGRPTGAARQDRVEPRLDAPGPSPRAAANPLLDSSVAEDVEQLQMSTLSFQDYVRERMLKRRQAELEAQAAAAAPAAPVATSPMSSPIAAARARAGAPATVAPGATRPATVQAAAMAPQRAAASPAADPLAPVVPERMRAASMAPVAQVQPLAAAAAESRPDAPLAGLESIALGPVADAASAPGERAMMEELRSMRGLIEQRFGALAFMEKLQRQPRQAELSQRLLDAGFSPALIRRLVQGLPDDQEALQWAGQVLARNLTTGESENALEDIGGVYALVGATGVGKTTSTAKLAAAFAARHGAANLGLITLDAYRVAAHEQLRAYGRILGVPVHTAHDRASLEDLLELLAGKRMVLIDTAGMAQRDSRTRELLDMLSHRAVQRLLVLNASAQGETIEDQIAAYAGPSCRGVVLSKIDEAVKLGPALDALIRHRLRVLAVANGQRVPEDWHRLTAQSLVQRGLKNAAAPAWRVDAQDVNLIFAGLPAMSVGTAGLAATGSAGAGANRATPARA
jgi:flagellar biosynthesis protein FlhF